MANFMSAMRSTVSAVASRSFLMDKAERYAASFGFGYIKGYYRERALFKGYPVDLWVGALATLGGAYLNVSSYGRSGLALHMDRIGDAGVMSYFNSIGAGKGNRDAGRTVQVLEGGKPLGSLPGHAGMIGLEPAGAGAFLTAEDIASYSGPR